MTFIPNPRSPSRRAHRRAFTGVLPSGYRSKHESTIATQLIKNNVTFVYEPFVLPYIQPEEKKKYTTDFILQNGIIIEVKGLLDKAQRKKFALIRRQHPDIDIRFVFYNQKKRIEKHSKTTYAEWCKKHDYQYAEKRIPSKWLQEEANPKNIESLKKIKGKKDYGICHI